MDGWTISYIWKICLCRLFKSKSLGYICKYLERWYDVEITLQPGLGEKIRYNGVIQEETVTDVMDALSRLSNISYHVKGKHISITSK